MREMIEATAEEEGMQAYQWYLSHNGTVCRLYERYADSQATMVHLVSFGSRFAERFPGRVEPTAFNVYGSPSGEVRGVLDSFGARHPPLVWADGAMADVSNPREQPAGPSGSTTGSDEYRG
jgi:hypothetical protein